MANAFEHKPGAWLQQAAELRAAGDFAGALAKEEEGMRQAIKLYFNSIEPRATYRGNIGRITTSEAQMFEVLKHLEVKTQNSFSLSITDVKKILKDNFHMGIEDVPAKLKEMVYRLES